MWYSTRRIVHNAGLLVTSTLLFIGITYIPLAAADNAKMDASEFRSSLDIKESDSSTKATVAENYGKLPLSFEVNNGQVDETVKFLSRGNGYTLYLTSDEAVLNLRRPSVTSDELLPTSKRYQVDRSKQAKIEVIRLKNIGVNSDTKIAGLEELPGKSNYFLGRDPKK
jgi:hypothetical protein